MDRLDLPKRTFAIVLTVFAMHQLAYGQWTTSGDDIYYDTGNVGIGISGAPAANLDIKQSIIT